MGLPSFNTTDRILSLMQSAWSTLINPLLDNPINSGIIIKKVVLASGDNTINHLLGRKLQGWFIVRQRSAASIYDKQDTNNYPALTLVLNSSAAVTVDLYLF